MTRAERFWAKVGPLNARGCRLWLASTRPNGYGQFCWERGDVRHAHRVAWELQHGPIPVGLQVLHRCDVKRCMVHLYLGSHQQNMRDAALRGQHAEGEQMPQAKLSRSKVLELRRQLGQQSQRELARAFGVSQSTVSLVALGKRWARVQP